MLFTAHSLPKDVLPVDDPYQRQVRETGAAVAAAAGLAYDRWGVAYQSAGRPGRAWLGPPAEDALAKMAGEGYR